MQQLDECKTEVDDQELEFGGYSAEEIAAFEAHGVRFVLGIPAVGDDLLYDRYADLKKTFARQIAAASGGLLHIDYSPLSFLERFADDDGQSPESVSFAGDPRTVGKLFGCILDAGDEFISQDLNLLKGCVKEQAVRMLRDRAAKLAAAADRISELPGSFTIPGCSA